MIYNHLTFQLEVKAKLYSKKRVFIYFVLLNKDKWLDINLNNADLSYSFHEITDGYIHSYFNHCNETQHHFLKINK